MLFTLWASYVEAACKGSKCYFNAENLSTDRRNASVVSHNTASVSAGCLQAARLTHVIPSRLLLQGSNALGLTVQGFFWQPLCMKAPAFYGTISQMPRLRPHLTASSFSNLSLPCCAAQSSLHRLSGQHQLTSVLLCRRLQTTSWWYFMTWIGLYGIQQPLQ